MRDGDAMPIWNIVLSGYPGSGKTVLARRLVQDYPNFLRLSVDDLRNMLYGSTAPSEDEEFTYNLLASMRDQALGSRHSVVIDCTAPKNSTRAFLLGTKIERVISLLVILIVEKSELDGRNRDRGMVGAVATWDKIWETPLSSMPVLKFRNNSISDFELSYYVLTDLLRSKVNPYRRRFLGHLSPKI
jgi:predicted kinase